MSGCLAVLALLLEECYVLRGLPTGTADAMCPELGEWFVDGRCL